jgi:hypothetical protein
VTKTGKFLRDTRLDELPQLFNILKGDMVLIGPRPERPAIYEKICRNIRNYDKRFSVKPGLIGYSQLLTPHNTPKAIRTLIDNRFLRRKQGFLADISIICYTIFIVVKKVARKIIGSVWNAIRMKSLGIHSERRAYERVRARNAKVYIIHDADGGVEHAGEAVLVDINAEAFSMRTNFRIGAPGSLFKLETDFKIPYRGKTKRKSALCTGEVYRMEETGEGDFRFLYIIKYTPVSPLNFYLVYKYFLLLSIA